jgi:hypothetical protein
MTLLDGAIALRDRALARAQPLDWLPLLLVRTSLAATERDKRFLAGNIAVGEPAHRAPRRASGSPVP